MMQTSPGPLSFSRGIANERRRRSVPPVTGRTGLKRRPFRCRQSRLPMVSPGKPILRFTISLIPISPSISYAWYGRGPRPAVMTKSSRAKNVMTATPSPSGARKVRPHAKYAIMRVAGSPGHRIHALAMAHAINSALRPTPRPAVPVSVAIS